MAPSGGGLGLVLSKHGVRLIPFGNPAGGARTEPSCLYEPLLGALRPNFRNHQQVHPPDMELGSLSPQFLRLHVRVGWIRRSIPTYAS